MSVPDSYKMPFGKYEGKEIGTVPASYLDWLRDQLWVIRFPKVIQYISANEQHIDKELKDEGRG